MRAQSTILSRRWTDSTTLDRIHAHPLKASLREQAFYETDHRTARKKPWSP
ncbi:MAG: hypothetical protein ACHRXM_12025 [Isosphaerales bacterium]